MRQDKLLGSGWQVVMSDLSDELSLASNQTVHLNALMKRSTSCAVGSDG